MVSPKHWRVILLTSLSSASHKPWERSGLTYRYLLMKHFAASNPGLLSPVAVPSRSCCFLGTCSEVTYCGQSCLHSGLTATGLQLV